MDDNSKAPDANALRRGLESVRDILFRYILPATGGSIAVGSIAGFVFYLIYCARIDYLPSLSFGGFSDLFACLTVAGLLLIVSAVIAPFLPGIFFHLAQRGTITYQRYEHEIFFPWFVCGAVVGGELGLFAQTVMRGSYEVNPSFGPLIWVFVTVFLLIVATYGLGRFTFEWLNVTVYAPRDVGELAHRMRGVLSSHRLLPAAFGAVTMASYAPFLVAMTASVTDFVVLQMAIAVLPIVLASLGNTLIATASGVAVVRAAMVVGAGYGGLCLMLLSGPTSDALMSQVGMRTYEPIEIRVSESDLFRIPGTVRRTLETQAELTTTPHTYAIRGLYLVLRIGGEFRIGVPRDMQQRRSDDNPVASSWTIPESAVITWRKIAFEEIAFPKQGERAPSPPDGTVGLLPTL